MNLAERGEYFGRFQPGIDAIRTAERVLSWAELAETTARVAGGLRRRGVEPGDRVAILATNSLEWCLLALGTLHAGAVVVPLNVRLAPPELRRILAHADPRAVAVDAGLAPRLDRAGLEAAGTLMISTDGRAAGEVSVAELAAGDAAVLVPRAGDDLAVLAYTSGTTGLPKGVMLTHDNLAACVLQTALAEGLNRERRTLLCIPLAFTGGVVTNFLTTYAVGGTVVLEADFDPDRAIELIEAEAITTWIAVPIMWQAVADAPAFPAADLSSLATAICGGSTVPGELMDTYHAKGVVLREAYGQTEASGSACVAPLSTGSAAEGGTGAGPAYAHTQMKILDEDRVELAAGELGEIALRGPQVMAGYWRDAAATAEVITAEGWLLTGDLGRIDERGWLQVVDRKKNMFISGGLNVFPAEVERVLDRFPAVIESVAFGLAHPRFGEACAAVVVVAEPIDAEALAGWCAGHLADYKCPRTVIVTEEPLPRGMSGKILRGAIADCYAPAAGMAP